jgi:hypothetical protein
MTVRELIKELSSLKHLDWDIMYIDSDWGRLPISNISLDKEEATYLIEE